MEKKDICLEIENNEILRKYVYENKVMVDDNKILTEHIKQLTEAINEMNVTIEHQVLTKHNDLLIQASHISDLEVAVKSVDAQVQNFLTYAKKLKDRIHIPYNNLENKIMVLERLQNTCNLLRLIAKILVLYEKLAPIKDNPAKEAIILFEITNLIGNNDFEGITILKDILKEVEHRRRELLQNSTSLLQTSLLNGDKGKLFQCFKVFHNLQCTQEQIENTMTNIQNELQKEINNALNVQLVTIEIKKTGSNRMAPGKANIMNIQDFKHKLWDNINKLFKEDIYNACSKVIMLQNVVIELHTIGNFRNIVNSFWSNLAMLFSSELEKSGSTVNQCIEMEFPKLLKCFNDLMSRLRYKDLEMKRLYFTKWENSFLSKSLGKLLEPVRTMWHLSQIPTMDQIDNAVRVIAEALSISLGDKQLSISLAHSVAKCIKQMNLETEQRLVMDSDVAQIIEPPTSSQQKNADLCNALDYFTSQVKRVLVNMNTTLPSESIQIVESSLKDTSSLQILQLFAESIKSSLHIILLTMHEEPDFTRNDDPSGKVLSCSPYMKELQQFISRCKDIYLVMFNEKLAVYECCIDIAKNCIKKFIEHVCNVRPLTKFGRVKLQIDCKHLETALNPLVGNVGELDEFCRQLKALYILLEKTPQDIAKSQADGASLSYSLVMMFLFSFGGPQLVSPHTCAGWNIQKLMQWLDTHQNEKERLEFVAGALQRYQNYVRQNQIVSYDEVYPILLQLLEDGRKLLKN